MPVPFFIGTYTSDDGHGGIYRAALDLETGAISDLRHVGEAKEPSFLALSPGGRFLYAVQEGPDSVAAFAVGEGGGLTLLNSQPSEGDAPCHLATDREGKRLFVANYSSGTAACLPILDDGSLAPAISVFRNQGTGPDKGRQEGPHSHSVNPDAEGRFLYACDLGTDEVLLFCLEGGPDLGEPRRFKTPPGMGPRHLAFHPNGMFAFVNGEMGSRVVAYLVEPGTGALDELQTLSTVPPGFAGRNGTAEILCHPNGRWLYVSNRGHDSLAMYEITENGTMLPSGIVPATVAEPRGVALTPDGTHLIVAGQNSQDLAVFAVDADRGTLTPKSKIPFPAKPVCILFAPV